MPLTVFAISHAGQACTCSDVAPSEFYTCVQQVVSKTLIMSRSHFQPVCSGSMHNYMASGRLLLPQSSPSAGCLTTLATQTISLRILLLGCCRKAWGNAKPFPGLHLVCLRASASRPVADAPAQLALHHPLLLPMHQQHRPHLKPPSQCLLPAAWLSLPLHHHAPAPTLNRAAPTLVHSRRPLGSAVTALSVAKGTARSPVGSASATLLASVMMCSLLDPSPVLNR